MDRNATLNFTEIFDCDNFLGPDSLLSNGYFQLMVYFMYTTIFLVAFMGNSFVCYVVLSSPRMRTVTNYFITNLAVGDMLITVLCVPFTPVPLLKQYWPFGSVLCPVVNYSQALSVFVSAYTLVAISIDKYIVIMWPLKPRISKRFATGVILTVWLVAVTTVIPTGMFAKTFQPVNESHYSSCDRYVCQEDYSDVGQEYGVLYSQFLMVMQYVIPSIVLLFTYTSIAAVIWCHRIPGEAENSRDIRIAKSKRKMIKMMVTVVLVYSLCWLPFNILMVAGDSMNTQLIGFLYFPFHGLAMSHACYNPIIYCFMNSRFREAFHQLLQTIPYLRKFHSRNSLHLHRTGIGYETALNFAQRGARVILACRDAKKAALARDRIVSATGNHDVIVRLVDFASLSSVRRFAEETLSSEDRLDILVNNAGAGDLPNTKTEDGLQILMQVNYFGPVLLTLLLLDLLKKSSPSRIVNVSSLAAKWGRLKAENLNHWNRLLMYSNSKLGNLLFTVKLAAVLKDSGVSVFSVHPGVVKTNITQTLPRFVQKVMNFCTDVFLKSAEEGAQTTLHASLTQGIEHLSGRHFEECHVVPTYSTAKDPKFVNAVWDKTMELLNYQAGSKKLL